MKRKIRLYGAVQPVAYAKLFIFILLLVVIGAMVSTVYGVLNQSNHKSNPPLNEEKKSVRLFTEQGFSDATNQALEDVADLVIYDPPSVSQPPHYVQTDPQWKDLPYSSGTIESHGCGLTACASYLCYALQDPNYNVASLYNEVGNSCLTGGVNDMGKFCQYISSTYGVSCSEQYWDTARAIQDLRDGKCLFASIVGSIEEGYRYYGGHVVLIYKIDESGIWISDPGDPSFNVPISEGRFHSAFYGSYFYSVVKQ